MPTFAAFYRAINNGRDPFPWQSRLAAQVSTNEQWPAEVGVPTGLGKTACLDIAVWWLASQADRAPAHRTAPTRIWWVVNRRLLVDSTARHAKRISLALCDPWKQELTGRSAEIVATVADRLRSLSADPAAAPLEVIRLRGGIASRRPTDPSRPAVILSTLPMYGSRLLFRGYGSTRSMRPIDAAMAGTDSLVLLDEAHLAPHLKALLDALADCTPSALAILGEARSRSGVVALTATGDATGGSRFDLDADDEEHQVVRQRLDAVKPMEVHNIDAGDIGQLLADAALSLIRAAPAPAACVVFANTPDTARAAFSLLQKLTANGSAEVLLLTGRSREREAEQTRERILDPVRGMVSTRDAATSRQCHLIVVATQTLEVGADIDAEYLVTEACGVRALTQRLGRLNRLGRYSHARAAYIHLPPPKSKKKTVANSNGWPVYGLEPASVLQRLEDARGDSATDAVNLSPRRVAGILGSPSDDPGRAPEVLPGLLWEWIKTTTPPVGEAPVGPYFSGIADPDSLVSLIWRAHVPRNGELLWPRAADREAVEIPIGEVRDALGEDEDLHRLGSDGMTIREVSSDDLRPGDVVVLPSDRGLLDEFGWDPSSTSPVVDMSIVKYGLPLDATALRRLCGNSVGDFIDEALINKALGIVDDDGDTDEADRDEAMEQILTAVAAATPLGWDHAEWNEFIDTLNRQPATPRNEVPRLPRSVDVRGPRSDELDEMSLAETAVNLDLHCQAVAVRAREVAGRLGITADLTEVVERAGLLHDIGKVDCRFQRWLDPEGKYGGARVAKSNMPPHRWNAARAAAGWPRGGRHEVLSARLVLRWLERHSAGCDPSLRDLLLHLILSHHGSGRPLVPPVADDTIYKVRGIVDDVSVEAPADLSIVDWKQPARFRRLNDQFGPWGLALLEAIVRQADHAVSAGADVGHLEVH
ncbi:MAG: type I-U CRISPR-associated helicase/endonuclease Cas3 [Truepera sp.]|nr:type I-U CRISPR-associated helicase/endonuclease Cas3 [Truepera sp.]